MEQEFEKEYQGIRKRRSGFSSWIGSITNKQFMFIFGLIALGLYLYSQGDKDTIIILGIISGVALYFFGLKSQGGSVISKEAAKKFAIAGLGIEKERGEILPDMRLFAGNCFLRRRNESPVEWLVGVEGQSDDGKRRYWRVHLDPYNGKITGKVRINSEYMGDELPSVIVSRPEFFYSE